MAGPIYATVAEHVSGFVPTKGTEGKTHINIYSNSKVDIGRKLSNFAFTPFNHPVFGEFASIEGFWGWNQTGRTRESFKRLIGLDAKRNKEGLDKVTNKHFKREIISVLHCKLIQNPKVLEALLAISSDLPLTHYYVFQNKIKDSFKPNRWWIEELELIRLGKPLMSLEEIRIQDQSSTIDFLAIYSG